MSRFPVPMRRPWAVGALALLLAVLVGCGRQEAEVARQKEAEARAIAERAEAERAAAEQANTKRENPTNGDAGEALSLPSPTKEAKSEASPVPRPKGVAPSSMPVFAPPVPPAGGASLGPLPAGSSAAGPGGTGADADKVKGAVSALSGAAAKGKGGATLYKPKTDPARPSPDGYNAANAEAYGVYEENEFRSPLVAALSTFSADVNTASYANVRRMLTDGKLPPASAVFLAEFVNYFPYRYAQPKGDDPVAFHVEMGPCPWNRKHHLVRVGVQAYQIPADKMPARNLVFLIDTSGSMGQENRLPLVKKALALLVEQLGENDRVSIVTYAGDSRVALPPTKGTDKKVIQSMIDSLNPNGGTNGEGGIRKAYDLARATFIDGGVNRVILCTDGDFNVGVTDNGDLVKLIEEQRRSKVFLTILGFGMGNYKDDRLKQLANHGNGHHAYIDTLDEARKVFVEQGGALVCVAKDVKFQIDFNPARVNAYRLVGYENRLLKDEDFKNDAKDAGDMGSGHQVTVLYEIVPKGVDIELPGVDPSKYQKTDSGGKFDDERLTVKMRYKHPEAETSKELSQVLKGEVAKELSDDFRFAAATASFGMILRDSKFRGAMTLTGVLEEAQGCVGADPNGHRKQFLALVKFAKDLSDAAKNADAGALARAANISEPTLRKLAEEKKLNEVLVMLPPAYHAAAKEYFAGVGK